MIDTDLFVSDHAMLKTFSKAVDRLFNVKSGWDVITNLLIEYGYGGNYWSEFNYPSYSFNGYSKNVVVYHCISGIADAVADLTYILMENGQEIEKDDVLKLLKRPNPRQNFKEFIRYIVAYKLIAGNCYVQSIATDGRMRKVLELNTLRPDRVTIVPNTFALPYEYIYTINGKSIVYPVDPVTFLADVLHIKYFHPLNDLYGLSPIQVAMMNIDQHNSANEWNQKLLLNHAKPSGIYNLKNQGNLSTEQREQIMQKLDERIKGKENAGNPVIAGMDVEYIQTSLTPAEMDWVNSKNVTSRDICLAFKYPAFMLGMAEGSTFNNLSEARISFYEETVLPLAESIYSELAYYLSRILNRDLDLIVDKDRISALSDRRIASRNNAVTGVNAGIISRNEAREEIDYKPLPISQMDVPTIPAGQLPVDFDAADTEINPDDGGDDFPDGKKPTDDTQKSFDAFDKKIKSLEALL